MNVNVLQADLSCRSTRTEVGTIFTQGSFLTLKYITDPFSKADNGFRLVMTAFKEARMTSIHLFSINFHKLINDNLFKANHCKEHKCLNTFCISRDLSCDGINHCGDNSDETSHASCEGFSYQFFNNCY